MVGQPQGGEAPTAKALKSGLGVWAEVIPAPRLMAR
jgi:hypothetical protein